MIAAISAALIVLLVLAVPRDSEAACAWVLWRQTLSGSNESWFPQEAHTRAADCKTFEDLKNRAEERSREQIPAEKRLSPAFSYLCLPDTVDPRGPKGGTR